MKFDAVIPVLIFFREFIYVFLKFYRILCCTHIIIKFLPCIKRKQIIRFGINATTKPYFNFLIFKTPLAYIYAKKRRKKKFLFFLMSIYILNKTIKYFSELTL